MTIGDTWPAAAALVLATQNPLEQEGTYPLLKRRWTVSCSKPKYLPQEAGGATSCA